MMMSHLRASALALALTIPIVGCDSPFESGNSPLSITMDSKVGSSLATSMMDASLSASESSVPGRPGNGPISLENIQSIKVGISQVLVLPATASADSTTQDGDGSRWVPLTVTAPELDLMALKDLQTLAELSADAGVTGQIAAVRLVFGAASVTFKDGTSEALFIPSSKITLETPQLVVDATATSLPLTFLQGASVKKIIRTGRGLLMPPVFSVAGDVQDEVEPD